MTNRALYMFLFSAFMDKRGAGAASKKGVGTGMQTLRLKSKGPATLQEVVSSVII